MPARRPKKKVSQIKDWIDGGNKVKEPSSSKLMTSKDTGANISEVLKDTNETAPTPYKRWTNSAPKSFLVETIKKGETLHPKLLAEAKKMREEVHQTRMSQMDEAIKDDELTTKEHVKRKEIERKLADNEMTRKQANIETAQVHDANAGALHYMSHKYSKQLAGANNFISQVQSLEGQMFEDF